MPPLTDANGGIDGECTPYADTLISFTPADGGSSDEGNNALLGPDDALVTIATDDILTVAFIGLGAIEEMDDLAADIRVHATTAGATEVSVNLSIDGVVWETAGTLPDEETGDTDIDIADTATLSLISYVQLIGVSGALSVDALESLQTLCPTSVR